MTIVLGTVLSCFSHVQLCDSMDYTQLGSSVHGIHQARILRRVAMVSSRESSRPSNRTHISYFLHCQTGTLPRLPSGKSFMIISEPIYKLIQFINNLRYAVETTLMAESKEELKSLLLKLKEKSEKVGLKHVCTSIDSFIILGPVFMFFIVEHILLPFFFPSTSTGTGTVPVIHCCNPSALHLISTRMFAE